MKMERLCRGAVEPEDFRSYLYKLLVRRPCTEAEALERLLRKGMPRNEASDLVAEFVVLGLIDDAGYARLFVDGHTHWGCERIRHELRRRGIRNDIAAEALEEEDDVEKARLLAESWAGQGLEWRKIEGRLARRGFSLRTLSSLGRDEIEW